MVTALIYIVILLTINITFIMIVTICIIQNIFVVYLNCRHLLGTSLYYLSGADSYFPREDG